MALPGYMKDALTQVHGFTYLYTTQPWGILISNFSLVGEGTQHAQDGKLRSGTYVGYISRTWIQLGADAQCHGTLRMLTYSKQMLFIDQFVPMNSGDIN